MDPDVKVRVISTQRGWESVFTEVAAIVGPDFAARPNPHKPPLKNILDQMRRAQCTYVIVGYPFRDEDYLYDYNQHFGQSFHECGKYCVRMLFFSGENRPTFANANDPEVDDLLEFKKRFELEPAEFKEGDPHYLGFMVLRPTGADCVGRTLIDPFPSLSSTQHIHAIGEHVSNLHGTMLRVMATPFMQQDKTAHVCAGAALWSMCYDLHHRYRTPRVYPRQVTEIACECHPHGTPDGGLSATQCAYVLRRLGCEVDLAHVKLEGAKKSEVLEQIVDTIYGYVQGNTPVLLGYKKPGARRGHMVAVVGHDYEDSPPTAQGSKSSHPIWSSKRVNYLYCQDDQQGPYTPLRIHQDPEPGENKTFALEEATAVTIVTGLSESVHMTYEDAKREVLSFLADMEQKVEHGPGTKDLKLLMGAFRVRHRLRLYLQQTRRFRQLLLEPEHGRGWLPSQLVNIYCCNPLPKFIYVCDICGIGRDDKKRFPLAGELILDATAPKFAHNRSILAFRWRDLLLYRNEHGGQEYCLLDWDPKRMTYAPDNTGGYRWWKAVS